MPTAYALLGVRENGEGAALVEEGAANEYESKQPPPRKPCWKKFSKRIVNSVVFKVLGVVALVTALFGGGLVTILDLPDNPTNLVLDCVMSSVMVFFLIELFLRSAAEADYLCSFFFWMDVAGTVSMIFEISFMLGSAGKIYETDSGPNTAVVRTARAARIGARAGRLSKPLRVLSLMFRGKKEDRQEAGYTAKVLGTRLTQVFSSKVAMLTVVLTLGVPLFNIGRYPEDDFSMRSWGYKLEVDYARDFKFLRDGQEAPGFFAASVEDMTFFYGRLEYFPFRLDGYDEKVVIDGETFQVPMSDVRSEQPNRKSNIIMLEVDRCMVPRPDCDGDKKAAVYFDFRSANQYSAGMDMAVVVFIILCMCLESCDLSFSINRMMVTPMERMLDSAHLMAKQLNQAMAKARGKRMEVVDTSADVANLTRRLDQSSGDDDDDEDAAEGEVMNEIELLQGVFKKVIFLLNVFMEDQGDDEEIQAMDAESKGVLQDVVQSSDAADVGDQRRTSGIVVRGKSSLERQEVLMTKRLTGNQSPKGSEQAPSGRPSLQSSEGRVAELPPGEAVGMETWDLDMLRTEDSQNDKRLTHVMFATNIGQHNIWLELDTYKNWAEAVKAGHKDNPYTSFKKACDVTLACYRLLQQVQWTAWLGDLEAAVLLIAALAHDVGHPGVTNLFLIETSDELALRYNDKSPLENMSCAKLFEICKDPKTNVFLRMDAVSYKIARSVCISTILATDNACHFDMVKDVKKVYGTTSDICDAQAKKGKNFEAEYINQVLAPNSTLWLKVLLHLADISNPLSEFSLSKIWAEAVMEEFFQQGDQEKKLGIPVGMLNDRDKVSMPSAQIGFINVLLAPFLFSAVRVFSTLAPLCPSMLITLEEWHKLWLAEETQRPEEVTKREQQIQKIRDQVDELKGGVPLVDRNNASGGKVNLAGHWTCVATFGLEEFLAASGVAYMKRKAASSAPWPQWEFQQSGDHLIFVNHSALGHLREEFTVDGKPYTTLDGWKQKVQIIATWEKGALVVHKEGPQGEFRETRRIDESGKLCFELQPLKAELQHVKWGRKFERTAAKK